MNLDEKKSLGWWDHIYCFVKPIWTSIWMVCWYGLDDAIKMTDKELENLNRKRSILENWRK